MHLSTRGVQRLLTAAGYYNGGIDGDAGPKTLAAVDRIISGHTRELTDRNMNDRRRMVAAAQLVLKHAGYEPGIIDGYSGHNTHEAFNAWAYEREHSKRETFRDFDGGLFGDREHDDTTWPVQADVLRFYGPVGKNQTRVRLPYKMRLAWNTSETVSSFSCHEKVADAMSGIFRRTFEEYGDKRIAELGLDLFGGCLNVRRMRGGSAWSMHSWGIAVDLDPANNRLRWGRDRARFAQPEYAPFWCIVEDAGAVSLGRARDFDWMHFQFARL